MPRLIPQLQPQILMGQIFTQQQLLSREGGGRPVARGPLRLHPIPHDSLERVSHTVLPP